MKKAQEELKTVDIVLILVIVGVLIVRNYIQKPTGGVFACSGENLTCQFSDCPPGYAAMPHLKCIGEEKGNTCCQQQLGERRDVE